MAILGQQNPNTYRTDNVFTAWAGQTLFSCRYNPGTVDVYQNGAKLIPEVDYTANNGLTVELLEPALDGDKVQIICYKVNLHHAEFTNTPIIISGDAELTAGNHYIYTVNCNMTLPANPIPNWAIRIYNGSGMTVSNIWRNGKKIHGFEDDLVIDIVGATLTLLYVDEDYGWWVI
jgi:hypothetical protein